jgi:phosphomannomutase
VIFTDGNGRTVSGDRILWLAALGLHQSGALRHNTIAATGSVIQTGQCP